MKKPLIFASTLIATLFLSSAATLAINNTTPNNTNNTLQNLVAINSNLTTDNVNKLSTKDANIYAITDTTGTVNKTFMPFITLILTTSFTASSFPVGWLVFRRCDMSIVHEVLPGVNVLAFALLALAVSIVSPVVWIVHDLAAATSAELPLNI